MGSGLERRCSRELTGLLLGSGSPKSSEKQDWRKPISPDAWLGLGLGLGLGEGEGGGGWGGEGEGEGEG